jgi:hypothetical protein
MRSQYSIQEPSEVVINLLWNGREEQTDVDSQTAGQFILDITKLLEDPSLAGIEP